jgi:acyl-coenzyme A synthetase/AMP-(fatty) acid ligase
VIFGGEALELRGLAPWFENRGEERPRLVNMYGITETTVHVTYCPLTRSAAVPRVGSPIGKPILGLKIYLLDRHQQPVPVRVVGEIYVGGAGVARGYLNHPELTAEKFAPNPFSRDPGSRLYRTGDVARYLPDGNIEFLGRSDHQVKVRGFRIELGEIEAVLGRHPTVHQSVVLAREDTPAGSTAAPGTGKRLVAYIVPKQMTGPTVSELRSFLKEKLPEHMIPSAFVFLDALPLTSHGKVDRAALPVPDQLRPELERAFVAPRTPVEVELAGIWAKVLQLERVGIHDDFFELGGHSLLATQVISRLRAAFHIDLPLRSLFERPTVAGLAERIEVLRILGQGWQGAAETGVESTVRGKL